MKPESSWIAGPPCTVANEGLHDSFARIACSRPDAIAVVSDRRRTTYAELNRKAEDWSTALAAAGISKGDIVPIVIQRGADLITALLAVLKTGAAYTLLDPAWPTSRIQELIEQLNPQLVVTILGRNQGLGGLEWVPPSGPTGSPGIFQSPAVDASDPCCVFFTSGTTGVPKGVLTSHRATARLFKASGFARFTSDTVMPLAAPMPWDAFSLELWAVLLNGGTSVIIEEPYLTADSLRQAVSAHGVNTIWLTSSLFNMIVEEDIEAFYGLEQVLTGGERLSPSHVERFLRRHSGIMLLNGYGPVESTIFAATHRVRMIDCERPSGIPLGRPVRGTQIYVLDGDKTCNVEVKGEICIAGDGLAVGYLADPQLTAAKFSEVELDGQTTRVYRTGDLGAWGQDGLLQFAGRADRQVKVRGHRLEPGEVERLVERLLPVRSCRVVARRDSDDTAYELVAFCIPTESGARLERAQGTLRGALPSYQQPAAVVSVDSFPLTAQGKLDERALLAMATASDYVAADAGATTSPINSSDKEVVKIVREVFSDVLQRPEMPTDVSFFELGGNSLDAGRVCSRLGVRLRRPVPLSRLYRHQTIEDLAAWLRDTGPRELAPAVYAADGVEVPLTWMQLVFLGRRLANPTDRTAHCLLTWVVEGKLDGTAFETAIASVHERHEPLRAAYLPDPRPIARLVEVHPPSLKELPPTGSIEAAIRALRSELARDLDLSCGDVWRVALVRVNETQAVLGCVVHHIAFDGWSESVLANDLSAAYNAACGLAPPPEHPRIPLGMAYLHHVNTADDDPTALERLSKDLSGAPELMWPVGASSASSSPALTEILLGQDALDHVASLSARAGVSKFVVLVSQYASALADVTRANDFVVGVPVRQRSSAALDRAIGCHINMVCLRFRGSALHGGLVAYRETAKVVHRAFESQDVPLGKLFHLGRTSTPGRPPLFQSLFALQDNPTPHLRLRGLRTRFLRQPYIDLPLELHAELWPEENGGLRLAVSYRPKSVAKHIVDEIADRFADGLKVSSSSEL